MDQVLEQNNLRCIKQCVNNSGGDLLPLLGGSSIFVSFTDVHVGDHYLSTSEVRLATQTSPLMSIVPIFLGDITYNPL